MLWNSRRDPERRFLRVHPRPGRVLTRRDAHITRHAQVVKQAHEVAKQEWLLARQEESDWTALNQPGRRDLDEQVQFEASRGCGQRNPSLDGTRSKPHQQLREGDIFVYHPPRTGFSGANEPSWYADEFEPYTGCSTQPYVAVVVKVHRNERVLRRCRSEGYPFRRRRSPSLGPGPPEIWEGEAGGEDALHSVPTMLRTWSCVPSAAAHY